MISKDAVWLATGCLKGLGRAIAAEVLRAGYRVVATARDPSTLDGLVAEAEDRALALALDVTRPAEVAAAVEAAERRFGAVDVLVNNAGYGYVGAIEGAEDEGVRAMFETDVFGLWSTTKAILPGTRKRGRGHVVNISSVGGMVTYPAVGFYDMAKFIGSDALDQVRAKLTKLSQELDAWEGVTRSTKFKEAT